MKKKGLIITLLIILIAIIGVLVYLLFFKKSSGDNKPDQGNTTGNDLQKDIRNVIKNNGIENWEYLDSKVKIDDNNNVTVVYNNTDDWIVCAYFTKDHLLNIANSKDNILNSINDIAFECINTSGISSTKVKYSDISSINNDNYQSHAKYYDTDGNEINDTFETGLKKIAKTYNYKDIFRNPEDYILKEIKLTGEVVQVMEDSEDGVDYWALRVNMTKDKWGYYDDTVMILIEKSAFKGRIIEDDIITFYGFCADTYTYETVMGNQLTIPFIYAFYADLVK